MVQTRRQSHQQIQDLMKFSRAFTGILAFFGVGLAFAVVFTAVSISVLERTRELATLRTLGFSLRSIAWLTTIENLSLAAAGIVLGLPLGRWLDVYLMTSFESESVTLEPVIYLRTYLFAVGGVIALTLASQLPSLLGLRRLNLAAATKDIGT
jgi:putative ABC transport system permease protein